eukprot:1223324-Amphidinium_carterae.1
MRPTGESQPKQRLKSHMDAAESHADVASKPRSRGGVIGTERAILQPWVSYSLPSLRPKLGHWIAAPHRPQTERSFGGELLGVTTMRSKNIIFNSK